MKALCYRSDIPVEPSHWHDLIAHNGVVNRRIFPASLYTVFFSDIRLFTRAFQRKRPN